MSIADITAIQQNRLGPTLSSVTSVDIPLVARALAQNTSVETLYASHIGDHGAKALAEALKTNTALKTIYVQQSGLTIDGITALAEALKTNQTLTHLTLRDGDGGNPVAYVIADMLAVNKTLEHIRLEDFCINDAGALDLLHALNKNYTLEHLHVFNIEKDPPGDITRETTEKINAATLRRHERRAEAEYQAFIKAPQETLSLKRAVPAPKPFILGRKP